MTLCTGVMIITFLFCFVLFSALMQFRKQLYTPHPYPTQCCGLCVNVCAGIYNLYLNNPTLSCGRGEIANHPNTFEQDIPREQSLLTRKESHTHGTRQLIISIDTLSLLHAGQVCVLSALMI